MTLPMHWLSPELMRTMALALLHFLWQGAALAVLAFGALAFCRSASTRYVVAVTTLVLMLAAPVFTVVALSDRSSVDSAASISELTRTPSPTAQATSWQPLAFLATSTHKLVEHRAPSADYLLLLVQIWFAGVVFLSLRSLAGLVVVERLRCRESSPVGDEILELCLELQERLRLNRVIRYCKSMHLDAPAVAGWLRPVVLLPASAISGLTTAQLEAVIAHELAHIRRYDAFVNLLQIGVETLLFYHPAVWWLGRQIREERENCCDDAAVAVCGSAVTYAHALTRIAESRVAPRLAMAANRGPLAARVARLLGTSASSRRMRSSGLSAGVLCLSAAVVAGSALVGILRSVHAHSRASAPVPVVAPAQQSDADAAFIITAPAPRTARARKDSAKPPASPAPRAVPSPRLASSAMPAPQAVPAPAVAPAPKAPLAALARVWAWAFPPSAPAATSWTQEASAASEAPKTSYIDAMKAAGLDNLTVDELVSLKVQGVTPEYIKQMHDLGFKTDVDSVLGMKVQGVTPDYVRAMRDLGLHFDAEELIGMKVQGISPDYVKEMRRSTGQPLAGVDELIGMKVQGITPEYIKQLHDMGFKTDAETAIGMKVQGITPEYVKQMHDLGVKMDADDMIGMKVQGVTPEYIKTMRSLGLQADSDDIIGMKVQGVTPEYVKSFEDIGLHPDTEEIIGMKVQGVTAEYLKKMQAAGFKLDIDDAIGAKVQGITPEFIEKVRSHGFKNLTLDQLMALKHSGVLD